MKMLLIVLLLFLCSAKTTAQQKQPPRAHTYVQLVGHKHSKILQEAILRSTVVTNDSALVQVLSGDGLFVAGLDTSDFLVASRQRGIATITRIDTILTSRGLALTFVLDNSASMFHAYDSLTVYLDSLIQDLRVDGAWSAPPKYSAVVFDNLPRTSRHLPTREHDLYIAPLPFTESTATLEKYWHYYDTIRTSFTPLYDAISEGLDPSEDLGASIDSGYQHVLIVVSDGADNASRLRLDDLAGLLKHRGIRMFAINFRTEPDGRLLWITRHVDGSYYYAKDLNQLRETLATLKGSLFAEYVLHYHFPPLGASGVH